MGERKQRRECAETHSSSVGIIGIAARRHASQSAQLGLRRSLSPPLRLFLLSFQWLAHPR